MEASHSDHLSYLVAVIWNFSAQFEKRGPVRAPFRVANTS
jgi:hypothetical protein